MRLCSYQSLSEAKLAREDINKEIKHILERDLEVLDEEERSVGQWYSLIGKDPEFSETKDRLSYLENVLADIEIYISSYKTVVHFE